MWFYIYFTHAKSRRQTPFPFKLFWVGPLANFCYTYFVLSAVSLKKSEYREISDSQQVQKPLTNPLLVRRWKTAERCARCHSSERSLFGHFDSDRMLTPEKCFTVMFGATSRCLPSCGLSSWTIHPCCVFDDVQWQFPRQQQQLSL